MQQKLLRSDQVWQTRPGTLCRATRAEENAKTSHGESQWSAFYYSNERRIGIPISYQGIARFHGFVESWNWALIGWDELYIYQGSNIT